MREPAIYAIDDDPGFLQAMLRSLRSIGLPVHGYASATEFFACFDPQAAGCVVTDLRLPGADGLALQSRLVEGGSRLPIIFVTGHGETRHAVAALKAGAYDFLEKPFGEAALLSSVRCALDRDADRRRSDEAQAELRARFDSLSAREQEVFVLIAADLPNKVIARRLQISPRTVEHHREHLKVKMQARSLGDLLTMAMRLGVPLTKT